MNNRPLAIISIFFILGIILANYLFYAAGFLRIALATLILILLSFAFSRYRRISNIILLFSITSFACALYINSNTFSKDHISYFLKEESLTKDIVGIIKSPVLTRKPYYGKITSTYVFEIEAVKGDGDGWIDTQGLSQIRIQTEKEYGYGDRLLVRGTMKRPLSTENFKYREYLERQNIFALINTKENNVTILSNNYKSNPILKYTYLVRARLKNQIIEKMPLASGAFLSAILLGDRSELPKYIQTAFKNSGVYHLLAISGLHVGLIAFSILYLLKSLRIKREFSYVFIILFLVFFALLTLSRPSVVRAVTMACVFLAGMLLGRRADVYNSLGVAALFILVRNPKDVFNIGFQLSFLAVLSIVYLAPRFTRSINKGVNPYLRRFLYMPLAVSIAAWLGTFPLILYYFKVVTPISIVANLFIIPLVFVLLIGGLSFVFLGWVPIIGVYLAGFNNISCRLIFNLADFFASLKFGHFHIP